MLWRMHVRGGPGPSGSGGRRAGARVPRPKEVQFIHWRTGFHRGEDEGQQSWSHGVLCGPEMLRLLGPLE